MNFAHPYRHYYTLALQKDAYPPSGWDAIVDMRKESYLSFLFERSGIQEAVRYKIIHRSRSIAEFIVRDDGAIDLTKADFVAGVIRRLPFLTPFDGMEERLHMEHVKKTLENLGVIVGSLKKFSLPFASRSLERWIRHSLLMSIDAKVTDRDVKVAVLSACLGKVLQSVGSCFATAPCILVHQERMELFLKDLLELLSTASLKRVIRGAEHSVPISPSMGAGDIKKRISGNLQNSEWWLNPALMAAMSVLGGPQDLQDTEKWKRFLQSLSLEGSAFDAETWIDYAAKASFELKDKDIEQMHRQEKEILRQGGRFTGSSAVAANLAKYHRFLESLRFAKDHFLSYCDHPLLKIWEFTVASFSEFKMEFSNWNLYRALGIDPREPEGVGQIAFRYIEDIFEEKKKQAEKFYAEYSNAFDAVRTVEALARRDLDEKEARRLSAEYQSQKYHLNACRNLYEQNQADLEKMSTFYDFLFKQLSKLFPLYFQEIYDSAMSGERAEIYEDSPAGFRLVYKWGRADPSSWSLIYDEDEWIDAIVAFFIAAEPQLVEACEWEAGKAEIASIISAIIVQLRSKEFLNAALKRMRTESSRKPWSYVSGGTMDTLVTAYFSSEKPPQQEKRVPESVLDLVIFTIDVIKSLPPKIADRFLQDKENSLLAHSPSHAYLLKPGFSPFCDAWQDNGFTYTWVRDRYIEPAVAFWSAQFLSRSDQRELLARLSEIPLGSIFSTEPLDRDPIDVLTFRDYLIDKARARGHKMIEYVDILDGWIYENIPLIPYRVAEQQLSQLIENVSEKAVEDVLKFWNDRNFSLTAKEFLQISRILYAHVLKSHALPKNIEALAAEQLRRSNLLPPAPFVHAATNWPNRWFAFVFSPFTRNLEFWVTDYLGLSGRPLSSWKKWLDGSHKETWAIYTS